MSLFGFSGAMMNGAQNLFGGPRPWEDSTGVPSEVMPPRGGGFFGRGGAGRNIAGFIGDALLTASGGRPIYAPVMADRAEAQRQAQAAQAKRKADFEDFVRRQEYERSNPKPAGPNDTERDYELYERMLGEGAGKRFLESNLNRPQPVDVLQPDGSVVRQWISPAQGSGGVSGGPPPGTVKNGYRFKGGNPNDRNSWEPVGQGGPSPQGSGGFPRPY